MLVVQEARLGLAGLRPRPVNAAAVGERDQAGVRAGQVVQAAGEPLLLVLEAVLLPVE
jgi:hypothetical protein